MPRAPEPYFSACLEVLYFATLIARNLGWAGEQGLAVQPDKFRQLAVLMDAVHNLPVYVGSWECCDEQLLRAGLARYDELCGDGPRLLDLYLSKLQEGEQGQETSDRP